MGWELWLLELEQYVGSGADTTDDLQRWRLTDEDKDYLKRATHAWGRAEITHGEFGISQPTVSQHLEVLR